MDNHFRKAGLSDAPAIWQILQQGIARRKAEGSDQWQDGYPNPEVVKKDIVQDAGYVLVDEGSIAGYVAIRINDEPAYTAIEGSWLTNGDFVVAHRIAIADTYLGKGLAQKILHFIEAFALENAIYSIKADTNFDNLPMIRIFEKLGYVYCGEVYFRGSPRRAYEKVLR